MIIGIQGDIGAGKTTVGVKCVIEEFLAYQNKKILSNMHLKGGIPFTYIYFNDILEMALKDVELQDTIIFISEMHVWFDSRTSISKLNRMFSYFTSQTGKLDVTLIYDTQDFGQVDKRLRERTDIAITVEKQGTNHICYFYDKSTGKKGKFKVDGKSVYGYFDTKETVRQRETKKTSVLTNTEFKSPFGA